MSHLAGYFGGQLALIPLIGYSKYFSYSITFKSLTHAPYVKELQNFQEGLVNLVKVITFENRQNTIQNKLENDIKEIKNEKWIFVPGDKSTKFHKMTLPNVQPAAWQVNPEGV